MSGSIATSPSAPLTMPIRLDKNSDVRDDLLDVIEDVDCALAVCSRWTVEVPESLVPRLRELIGQHVVIGLFGGKYRAEVSHT